MKIEIKECFEDLTKTLVQMVEASVLMRSGTTLSGVDIQSNYFKTAGAVLDLCKLKTDADDYISKIFREDDAYPIYSMSVMSNSDIGRIQRTNRYSYTIVETYIESLSVEERIELSSVLEMMRNNIKITPLMILAEPEARRLLQGKVEDINSIPSFSTYASTSWESCTTDRAFLIKARDLVISMYYANNDLTMIDAWLEIIKLNKKEK